MKKNVSGTISENLKNRIVRQLKDIDTQLPFMVNLSPAERRSIPKLGRMTTKFVELALGLSEKHPELVPPYLDVQKMKQDFELARKFVEIMSVLEPLWEKMNDTFYAAGSSAHAQARLFYKAVKIAARNQIPGTDVMVKELKQSFRNPIDREKRDNKKKKSASSIVQEIPVNE